MSKKATSVDDDILAVLSELGRADFEQIADCLDVCNCTAYCTAYLHLRALIRADRIEMCGTRRPQGYRSGRPRNLYALVPHES